VLAQHSVPKSGLARGAPRRSFRCRAGSAPSHLASARAYAALQGGHECPPGPWRAAQRGTHRVHGVAEHDLARPSGRLNAVPVGDTVTGFSPRYVTIITQKRHKGNVTFVDSDKQRTKTATSNGGVHRAGRARGRTTERTLPAAALAPTGSDQRRPSASASRCAEYAQFRVHEERLPRRHRVTEDRSQGVH